MYAALLLFLLPTVHSWGDVGHELTGALANRLMNSNTANLTTSLLGNMDLPHAAVWADSIKYTKGYRWSAILHFVDSKDSPPSSCGVDYSRDCRGNQCVIGAIANYTTQLTCDNDQSTRSIAFKFLAHFIGDITQPLHTCARDEGGNKDKVTFDGQTRSHYGPINLHSIWDSSILEKRLRKDFRNKFDSYADYLYNQVKTVYPDVSTWTQCLDDGSSSIRDCALSWAQDSDGLNCDMVWSDYLANPHADLGGQYYSKAFPIAEKQLAKAGVRMARFFELNLQECD